MGKVAKLLNLAPKPPRQTLPSSGCQHAGKALSNRKFAKHLLSPSSVLCSSMQMSFTTSFLRIDSCFKTYIKLARRSRGAAAFSLSSKMLPVLMFEISGGLSRIRYL